MVFVRAIAETAKEKEKERWSGFAEADSIVKEG